MCRQHRNQYMQISLYFYFKESCLGNPLEALWLMNVTGYRQQCYCFQIRLSVFRYMWMLAYLHYDKKKKKELHGCMPVWQPIHQKQPKLYKWVLAPFRSTRGLFADSRPRSNAATLRTASNECSSSCCVQARSWLAVLSDNSHTGDVSDFSTTTAVQTSGWPPKRSQYNATL